jgi:BirA family biotin operon repressor/biotin-[acetyl-CoA-carboxylase] ligase
LLAQTPNLYSIGKPFIKLDQVESTNNYAMGLVHDGIASHGTVVYTGNQTNGKGQRGRQWESAPGKSLTMSIIIQPTGIFQTHPFSVLATTAISCYKLLKIYIPEGLSIKWPNDLYCSDKKAGGILVESRIREGIPEWMVIGIGINLNQEKENLLPTATSIKNETGFTIPVEDFAWKLIQHLNEDFNEVLQSAGNTYLEVYNRILYCRNRQVRLIQGDRELETVIRNVNAKGELITDDGIFYQGDVQWVRR